MNADTRFEDLLAEFTAGLSAVGPAELDQEIHRWLGQLGRFFEARNMGVGELVGTTMPFGCVWSLQSDVVPVDSMYDNLPWSTARLMRGEAVVLRGGLDGLPPEAEADRRAFEAAGGHPDVMVPLMDGDAAVGGLGIGLPDFERVWSETLHRRLSLVARVLAGALVRRRQLLELEERRSFETLTSEVVHALHGTREVGAALESALERIGRYFRASRALLITLPGTEEPLFGRHAWRWRSEDLPAERDLIPPDVPTSLLERLGRGEPVVLRGLDEVPDILGGLEEFLSAVGCVSCVLWPLREGKSPLVVFVLEWPHERRDWDETLQKRVEVLAEILGTGIAELELRDTAVRARAFLDANPSLSYIKDEELRHLYANRALLEAFGRTENDFLGTVSADFLPPEAVTRVEALDRRAMAEGAAVPVPPYSVDIAGERRWVQEVKFPIPLADGRVLVGGIVFDITEERRAQERLETALGELETRTAELARSEERYRTLVQASPSAILAIREGRVLFTNPAGARLLGHESPEDAVGLSVLSVVAPASRDKVAERLTRLETGQSNPLTEVEVLRPDGSTAVAESTSVAVELDDGPAAVIVAQDITDRREREQELRMMKFAFDHSSDHIGWMAPDGRFLYVNEAGHKDLHFTRDEILSMKISDVDPNFPPKQWKEHFQELKRVGSIRLQTSHVDQKGQTHHVDVFSSYLNLEGMEYICAFGRDITELKRTQEHLASTLAEVEELKSRLEEENLYLRQQVLGDPSRFPDLVGESTALRQVLHRIEQVASSDATCLIEGETGTGKELVAEAIHRSSARKDRPLVKVNCAALPASLVESELFGHEAGAFTGADRRKRGRFELADGGTLFLDEIGDLGSDVQAKLLRVLQNGEFERVGGTETLKVDVRILAATNRNLAGAVSAGRFRDDLFYRLNVFPIVVPPLRQRREDIPLLVWYFVGRLAAAAGKRIDSIPQGLMQDLVRHDWPGNVRELANTVERAVILSPGPVLRLDEMSPLGARDSTPAEPEDEPGPSRPRPGGGQSLKDVERAHILEVLEERGWKVSGPGGAAEALGLKESTLRFQMKRLGIRRPPRRRAAPGRAETPPDPGRG